MQLQHFNTNFKEQKQSIVLLCDSVNSPANIGSLFRIADSFGIEKIVFGDVKVDLKSARLKRTARSTQNWVQVDDEVILSNYITKLTNDGYIPIALEITANSQPIECCTFTKNTKIALVIGEENSGISEPVLEKCQQHVHISMFGKNSSMNVSQATAIALYEITKQIQQN